MPPLSVMIKPASSICNLRCRYCFYHSIADSRSTGSYGIMNETVLETIVSKALGFAHRQCTFAFQGGEPTMAGLDFFRKLVQLQQKYNTKYTQINNAIQTNGIVIESEWSRFLSDNKFLVGISLDGPKSIHDANRIDPAGKGTFNRVMKTIALFDKHDVQYNILTVVNAFTARHITRIYNFFKKQGFNYQQYIPCLDPLDEQPGNHDYSLTPERYAYFLKTLFDLWYDDITSGNMISIRYFDNLTGMLMGYPPEACGMSGVCNCQFVIEADGGVYPCDFYVLDKWYLGSIMEVGFEELKTGKAGKKFVEVSTHVDPACRECKWAQICRGGCRRNREPFKNDKPSLNYYCSSLREFFDYSASRLQRLAAMMSQRNG